MKTCNKPTKELSNFFLSIFQALYGPMATWLEFPYECSPRELEVVRNVYFVTLTDRDFSVAYTD